MAMAADQRTCPDCGNPYPFDNEGAAAGGQPDSTRQMRGAAPQEPTGFAPTAMPSSRPTRGGGQAAGAPGGTGSRGGGGGNTGGPLAALAPYRTALILIGVLVLIVVVGYLLFSVAMRYFESGRPEPGSSPNATPAPVVVPGPPSPGPSPSPSTLIQPAASPSPSPSPAAGVRMKIVNTDSQGANMRQRPSTTAPVLRTLPEGAVVEVIGGETNAEGRSWRNVRDPGGATGWVAADLLASE